MRPRALVFCSLAALAAPVAVAQESTGPPLTAPPPGLSLTGRWELDRQLSDDGNDAREGVKGWQSDHHRPPYPPVYPGPPPAPGDRDDRRVPTGPGIDVTTPGMTPPPADDPLRRGGSSGSSRSQSAAASDYVKDLPETLTIAQRPTLILIQEDDDEGRIRALVPDGMRHPSTDKESEHMTRWVGGVLKVETWHDNGVHVVEAFDLAPDRSRLTVTVDVDDGSTSLSVTQVYRPAPTPEA